MRNLFLIIGSLCLLLGLVNVIVPPVDDGDGYCDVTLVPDQDRDATCIAAWQARGTVSAACGIAGLAFMTAAVAMAASRPRDKAGRMPMAPPRGFAAGPPPGPPAPGPGPQGGAPSGSQPAGPYA